MNEIEIDITRDSSLVQTQLLEQFIDEHLFDANRVANTGIVFYPKDNKMIKDAMQLLVNIYALKIKNGEISKRMMH